MNNNETFQSENLNELFTSLAKAQGEMQFALKDSKGNYAKYADLTSCIEASREPLAKNGLAINQYIIEQDDGKKYLYTMIGHSSGQWMKCKIKIDPPKTDIQSLGSYITYLRRYNYCCITGVAPIGEDDDGEKGKSAKKQEEKDFEQKKIEENLLDEKEIHNLIAEICNDKEFEYNNLDEYFMRPEVKRTLVKPLEERKKHFIGNEQFKINYKKKYGEKS